MMWAVRQAGRDNQRARFQSRRCLTPRISVQRWVEGRTLIPAADRRFDPLSPPIVQAKPDAAD